jgi:hypothetical protein
MNEQQRQLYAEKHRRKIIRFERMFLRPLYDVLHAFTQDVADKVRKGDPVNLDSTIAIPGLGEVIADIYTTVGISFARQTMREINKSAREEKAFGFDDEWYRQILEYFRLYLLNKAVLPITLSMKDSINSVLEKGLAEGWGIDKMAFEIANDPYTLMIARRALRTEIVKAQGYGKELGERDSDFESDKIWIAARDHRTRHSHREMDGRRLPFKEKFSVNRYKGKVLIGTEQMDGPGDAEASAANVINCRCTLVVRAARDENGRLIRKNKLLLRQTSSLAP